MDANLLFWAAVILLLLARQWKLVLILFLFVFLVLPVLAEITALGFLATFIAQP